MKKKTLEDQNKQNYFRCFCADVDCFYSGQCYKCNVLKNVLNKKDNLIKKLEPVYYKFSHKKEKEIIII